MSVPVPSPPRVHRPVDPRTVLVVDDHEPLLELLTYQLRRDELTVVTAISVDTALDALDALPAAPAVAVVDDHMPLRDGYELIAELRERSPATAVVLFSGSRDDRIAARLEELSITIDAHLDKTRISELPLVIRDLAASGEEAEAAE